MKKLSFKAFVSLLMVLVLSFSVIYMPGMSLDVLAADCSNGHKFTATEIGANYLKSESTCGKKAVYYASCAVCGLSSKGTSQETTFEYGEVPQHEWSTFVNVPADCTKDEHQKQTCTRCKQEYIRYVPDGQKALGHQEIIRSNGSGKHTVYCTRSGCGYDEESACSTSSPVCGVIPTCDVCKKQYGNKVAHELQDKEVIKKATCTEKGKVLKKCARCDYTEEVEVNALGHKMALESVVTKVTCTADGKEKYKCSTCGETQEKLIPATGHTLVKTVVAPTCKEYGYDKYSCEKCDYVEKKNIGTVLEHDYMETKVDPTCTKDGSISYKCKTCGGSKASTVLPALDHDMSEFEVTTQPTCTAEGIKSSKCSRCSRTITETLPANGHDLVKEVVAPTCVEYGYTLNKCKNCTFTSKDNYVDPVGHDEELTGYIEPSCELNGWKSFKCKVCKNEIREEVAPLGHEFNYTSNGDATCTSDGTKSGKCIRCPKTSTVKDEGSKLGHKYTSYVSNNNASCTKNATEWSVCDRGCGAKDVRDIPNTALGHVNETIKGKAPTCTDTGLTDGAKCTRCTEITTKQEVIPAKGHNYTSTVVTAPTCVKAGTANFVCADCSHTYTGEIAATGEHKWDAGTVKVAADCENDGEMLHKCETCTKEKTEKINRLGHSYSTEYMIDSQPTCYREGEKSKHCVREGCTAKSETVKIAMLDHDLGDYESNGDATCEKDGTKSKKCKVCTYKSSPIADPGTKLGHKYTNYVSDNNATCLTDGTKTALCDNGCGHKDTLPEKAYGHDERVDHAKAPTCTESGLTEGKTCNRCGQILVAQEIIDATGHNEAEKAAKEPTCTKTGLTAGVYCINCEEDIIPQETLPKLGHDYNEKVTKATTSKDGKIEYSCKRCGYEKTGKIYAVKSIKLATSTFYYNGETQAPEKAVVTDTKNKTLTAGVDYDIDYSAGSISAKVGTYKVKVVLKGKYSGSKTLSFKIVPGKISKIKTDKTTTSIKLNWSKSAGATGYRVYRYDTAKKKWVTVKKSTTSLSYTVKGLKVGTLYTFSVKPYYKKGDTVIWGESKRWETATLPATPTVKATAGVKSATLTWNKVSGATGYVIYYSPDANGKYTKVGSTKNNTYTVKNLTALKGACFKVKAYKKTANGNIYGAASKYVRTVPKIV